MNYTAKILLVEDDLDLAGALQRLLTDEGWEVLLEARGDTGLKRGSGEAFDLVITDLKLAGLDGLELVRQLHAVKPRLPIILMTAHGTTETAIEAIQVGAYDYLLKPFDMAGFLRLVEKTILNSRLMSEPVGMGTPGASRDTIIGQSQVMQGIYKEIGRVAATPVTVLIRGETGTGKELIARAIYQHSDRAREPFIAINCAAIPETLLESELFGHERGAFTGADTRRIGRFEQAHRGTIFLDEIGDLSPYTQVKLLRVLQEKCLQRLGGKETIPTDVRVIAATHRDLEQCLQRGQFREDLYYRLSVVAIHLPPIRDRFEDIPELMRYFLKKYGAELGIPNPTIHPDALRQLQAHAWPGNVRELENVARKVLLLARSFVINSDHVKAAISRSAVPFLPNDNVLGDFISQWLAAARLGEIKEPHGRLLALVERELFRQAIQSMQGNQAKAARMLGVSRLTMLKKLLQFGLHPSQTAPNG